MPIVILDIKNDTKKEMKPIKTKHDNHGSTTVLQLAYFMVSNKVHVFKQDK